MLQIMESSSQNPGCLVIAASKEKLIMLEENNKWVLTRNLC